MSNYDDYEYSDQEYMERREQRRREVMERRRAKIRKASYALQKTGHPYICVTGDAHSAWRAIYDHVDIYLNNTK